MIELHDKDGNLRFTIYDKDTDDMPYSNDSYWIVKNFPKDCDGEGVNLTEERFIELLDKYWDNEF